MITRKRRRKRIVDKLIVVFDICSSSNIIEYLTKTTNLDKFEKLLKDMDFFMQERQVQLQMTLYKFVGDGWILLFPVGVSGPSLFDFLRGLSEHFRTLFDKLQSAYLESPPVISGLTFGVEKGSVNIVRMAGTEEFVGRAINIACRLQSAIKDKDPSPSYKALVSKQVFSDYFSGITGLRSSAVTRTLRNINGGKYYPCHKLFILPAKRHHRRKVRRLVRRNSSYDIHSDLLL